MSTKRYQHSVSSLVGLYKDNAENIENLIVTLDTHIKNRGMILSASGL